MPAAAEIQRVAGPLDFDVQHRTQLNPTTHAKTVALEVKNLPADAHVPSSQKIVPGSYKIPAGVFPQSPWSFPDANVVASKLVERLNKALKEKVADNIGVLFHENSYWRDHLCFTWDLRTLKEPEGISHFVSHSSESVSIAIDASTPFRAPKYGPLDGLSGESSNSSGILFFVNVTTKAGAGRGVAKLAEVQGQWKFFTIFTTLEKLHGHEEHLGKRRPNGAHHGAHVGRQNWKDRRDAAVEFQEREPAVLIVGAGQSGLTTAARLKALDIDTLCIDHEDRVGDNWRRRYRHLVLHDPVWLNYMPYLKYPAQWPMFTPKDKLAEFFEAYVTLLELNVWVKTTVMSSSWDAMKQQWTVVLQRGLDDGTVEMRTVHPAHIIQATGHAGPMHMPVIEGMESFRGNIAHSTEFTCAAPNGQGKKAVVVGSSNSAHDIAQDFYEQGYDVTMVQRSTTLVISSKFRNACLEGMYEEDGPPIEDADLLTWGLPMELFKAQQIKVCEIQNKHDAELLEGLARVGFSTDRGVDNSGYMMKYLHRGGGYYVDVGASQLVVDGKIKLKQGAEIAEMFPNEITYSDGTRATADEIVFATGFQNMRTQTRVIFGDNVADRVEGVWGFDKEGEVRTMWRRTGQPGFWYMGTNFAYCRYFSRVVALQIKAIQEGITYW